MKTYVFSLGLVPVQQWIAEARRSRDLRTGSALLSYVMGRVLGTLERDARADVRLPSAAGRRAVIAPKNGFARNLDRDFGSVVADDYGIPNRASGYCEAGTDEELQGLFGGLEPKVVEKCWLDLQERHLLSTGSGSKGSRQDRQEFWHLVRPWHEKYRQGLGKESDCPFSLVWVAREVDRMPDEKEQELFKEHLTTIDRLYAEVKRTRPVRRWSGATVGKCGQCGRREAIGPAESFKEWRGGRERLEKLDWLVRGYIADRDERLCWVCLTRRLAGYASDAESFPSTGTVASAPWREEIDRVGGEPKRLLEDIEQSRVGAQDLGRALYLPPRPQREKGDEEVLDLVRQLRESIRRLDATGAERGKPRIKAEPPRYLALLTFDGDDMGSIVRAAPLERPRQMTEFQTRLGEELGEGRSSTCPGKLGIFYLGGDEGLLMAPAPFALEIAHRIRTSFGEVFGTTENDPTLSAGVAYFEQSRPMKGAIEAARLALKAAKARDRKSSLGVGVETASGSRWLLAQRWGPFWDRIRKAVALVREGRLAAKWSYDVETLLESLSRDCWNDVRKDPEPLRAEVERLLSRHLIRGQQESRKAFRRARKAIWASLEGCSMFCPEELEGSRDSQAHLAASFHLIGFLVRESGLELRERGGEGGEEAA